MSDRERILEALGPARPLATRKAMEPLPRQADWAVFAEQIEKVGGRVVERAELETLRGKTAWIDVDAEPLAEGLGLERADLWEAEVGVTLADLAVAESGSLLLAAGPDRWRMASLAPELHVCFVRQSDLVGSLEEALPQLTQRTTVLITGSSRTADIEAVLVRGIHGPREIWVVPIEAGRK